MAMSMRTPRLRTVGSMMRTRFGVGVLVLAVFLLASVGLYYKPVFRTMVRPGNTITAEFDRNFKLTPHESRVLLAGLDVGIVSGIETRDDGVTVVSMKVDDAALDELGPEPSARVVPNTLLSGVFGVELTPGGGRGAFGDGVIPTERTSTPVELDRILEALPSPTRRSLQKVTGSIAGTLDARGQQALDRLMAEAPASLEPSGRLLVAAQGTRPRLDLPRLVSNLDATARALSDRRGRVADIVLSLRQTTRVLAHRSPEVSAAIATLPAALRTTRSGAVDLHGTLARLTDTADELRPVAEELDSLLQELGPMLRDARPLMADLRPLMRDARQLVEQLVPVAVRGTRVLDNLRGRVLSRLNGPIVDTVMGTWRGSGPYRGNGGGYQADHRLYEELGYLVAGADRGSMYQDQYGSMLGFQVGFNLDSLSPAVATPLTLPELLRQLRQARSDER